MREIIEVEVKSRKVGFAECKTDLLVVGRFSDEKGIRGLCGELDRRLDGAIGRLIKLGDFKGKEGTSAVVYGNERVGARRVLLVGLGERKKAGLNTIRKAAALGANQAVGMRAGKMAAALQEAFGGRLEAAAVGRVEAEGVYFGSYRYDEYVTKREDGRRGRLVVELIDPDSGTARRLGEGLRIGSVVGRSQNMARTLINRPGNVMYPSRLAEEAKRAAAGLSGLSCTVLDERELRRKKMGGIIAVGDGSSHKPRMIILRYRPRGGRSLKGGRIGLVGKAITFDSGGLSIKPSAHMDAMKMDMSGGGAVLGTMLAVAELGLRLDVCGIICAAENTPGPTSFRPGDIIRTYSGKTVEVQNTDAEGRLVLCDGLHYAVEQKCETIIDIATLTGACMVALGVHKAGLMSNNEKLSGRLVEAGERSGEEVWAMPSGDEYGEEVKSKIADLKNVGSKWGGACTAAAFLRQFVGKSRWAHLDIAGKMETAEPLKGITCGGSIGFGVRLLTSYLIEVGGRGA